MLDVRFAVVLMDAFVIDLVVTDFLVELFT